MISYLFETVDVFAAVPFRGNPLCVFPDASGLETNQMQSIAAEMNLSETAFVFPPEDAANTARVRIFNRTTEMAFAGHPSIGTAYVLAHRGFAPTGHLTLEVPAGIVRVEILIDGQGTPIGGRIEAPRPLSTQGDIAPAVVAACLGVDEDEILTSTHAPIVATVGNPYVLAEVKPEALVRCEPNPAAFRRALAASSGMDGRFSIHVYSRRNEQIRARMFAPLSGTWEDPATGSANAPLAALLLSLSGGDRLRVQVSQGVEMGRPSLLDVEARRTERGIMVTVAGTCAPVFKGWFNAEAKIN